MCEWRRDCKPEEKTMDKEMMAILRRAHDLARDTACHSDYLTKEELEDVIRKLSYDIALVIQLRRLED